MWRRGLGLSRQASAVAVCLARPVFGAGGAEQIAPYRFAVRPSPLDQGRRYCVTIYGNQNHIAPHLRGTRNALAPHNARRWLCEQTGRARYLSWWPSQLAEMVPARRTRAIPCSATAPDKKRIQYRLGGYTIRRPAATTRLTF